LTRLLIYDLPLELNFDDFNNKMQILLSKQQEWLELWNTSSLPIKKIIGSIKGSKQFIAFQRHLKAVYVLIGVIIGVSVIFSLVNPVSFIIVPIAVLVFIFLLFYKKKMLHYRFSKPNRKIIEDYLKGIRGDLIKLVKYLKSHMY